MSKIKTSISIDHLQMARLKRLAWRERRSISQVIDLALEQLIPLLENGAFIPSSPNAKELPTTPSPNPTTITLPHSAFRVPSSALSTKTPSAPKSTKQESSK
ncbi:hypothetical protein BH09VER1_BH09VER1_44220 [soil metagenome]